MAGPAMIKAYAYRKRIVTGLNEEHSHNDGEEKSRMSQQMISRLLRGSQIRKLVRNGLRRTQKSQMSQMMTQLIARNARADRLVYGTAQVRRDVRVHMPLTYRCRDPSMMNTLDA